VPQSVLVVVIIVIICLRCGQLRSVAVRCGPLIPAVHKNIFTPPEQSHDNCDYRPAKVVFKGLVTRTNRQHRGRQHLYSEVVYTPHK